MRLALGGGVNSNAESGDSADRFHLSMIDVNWGWPGCSLNVMTTFRGTGC
jgi:hypothetical protein